MVSLDILVVSTNDGEELCNEWMDDSWTWDCDTVGAQRRVISYPVP